MKTTLTLAALAATLAIATPAEANRGERGTTFPVPVEYQAADKVHAQLVAKFRDIRNLSRLSLDMAFDLDAGATNGARAKVLKRTVQFGTDAAPRIEELPCLTDKSYDLNYTGQHYFTLKLFENYDYVRLRVYPGDKTQFPANDVSCVHDQNAPGGKRFRIMGKFIAITVPTQQGVVVQLRPVE
ncbi:MAG: hypothetical protein ACRC7G_03315 [Beijerinckiaceae bacterium]